MNWKQASWLAIDTGTTGVDPRKDRIVSVAVARKRADEKTMKLCEWLVNPGVLISPEASTVHGITDEMVRDKPALLEVSSELLRIVERADVLVGYHWPFDDAMLLAGLGDIWEDAIAGRPVIDVLTVVRFDEVGRYWKGKGRHKLANAATHLSVKLPANLKPHQASADCWLTIAMLSKLAEFLPDDANEAAALIKSERKRQDDAFAEWKARQPPLDEPGSPAGKGESPRERG